MKLWILVAAVVSVGNAAEVKPAVEKIVRSEQDKRAADRFLDEMVQQTKRKHPRVDFNERDGKGEILEARVLEYALAHNQPDFEKAFIAYCAETKNSSCKNK